MGFNFIAIMPLLQSHYNFLFILNVEYSFLVSSSIFVAAVVVDFCSPVSCDFGVFVRRRQIHVLLLHHVDMIRIIF